MSPYETVIFSWLTTTSLLFTVLPAMAAADKLTDAITASPAAGTAQAAVQTVELKGGAGGRRFDGIGADVYLNPGDSAGILGRVNDVGTGYGCIPKGYFLQLGDDGQCRLVVVRGKKDKKKATGDAEQQALLRAGQDDGEGGERVLGAVQLPNIGPDRWHHLTLRFDGSAITGLVDEKPVLSATDALYARGMAGLMAGGEKKKLSTPYFDNVLVKGANAAMSNPASTAPGQSPIYKSLEATR